MSILSTVRSVIQKMSKEERKVARSFLTSLSQRGADAPNQTLKLFDVLCDELKEESPYSDVQVEHLVYSEKSDSAFPRLVLRLKDKIIESLTLSVNLERTDAYSERGRALHETRKELSQAQIMHSRGLWQVALPIVDDCIKKSAKFEHYEEWAAALRLRMEIRTIQDGQNFFETDNKTYEKVLRGLIASKRALEHYYKLISRIEFKAGGSHLEELQTSIDILQHEFEKSGSANVAFFLHYLEVQFYQDLRLYVPAAAILKTLCDLVENSPAVSSPDRLAGAYINRAWNEICIRRFSAAIMYLGKAKSSIKSKSFNYYQCIETEFYALFYSGDYNTALERINELVQVSLGGEFRAGKRQYQKACVLFMLGQHDLVQKELTQLNPIEDDDEGWNLALRTLFVMNDIELDKIDNADKRIENMRKHISKLRKNGKERKREMLKFEVLRALLNSDFDFQLTKLKCGDELTQLKSDAEECAWRIMSPEMILFDQWIESKAAKKKLTLVIPAYTEPVLTDKEMELEGKIKQVS